MAQQISDDELRKFMLESTSTEDWNRRCDELKKRFGGRYPENWFMVIMVGGVAHALKANGTLKD